MDKAGSLHLHQRVLSTARAYDDQEELITSVRSSTEVALSGTQNHHTLLCSSVGGDGNSTGGSAENNVKIGLCGGNVYANSHKPSGTSPSSSSSRLATYPWSPSVPGDKSSFPRQHLPPPQSLASTTSAPETLPVFAMPMSAAAIATHKDSCNRYDEASQLQRQHSGAAQACLTAAAPLQKIPLAELWHRIDQYLLFSFATLHTRDEAALAKLKNPKNRMDWHAVVYNACSGDPAKSRELYMRLALSVLHTLEVLVLFPTLQEVDQKSLHIITGGEEEDGARGGGGGRHHSRSGSQRRGRSSSGRRSRSFVRRLLFGSHDSDEEDTDADVANAVAIGTDGNDGMDITFNSDEDGRLGNSSWFFSFTSSSGAGGSNSVHNNLLHAAHWRRKNATAAAAAARGNSLPSTPRLGSTTRDTSFVEVPLFASAPQVSLTGDVSSGGGSRLIVPLELSASETAHSPLSTTSIRCSGGTAAVAVAASPKASTDADVIDDKAANAAVEAHQEQQQQKNQHKRFSVCRVFNQEYATYATFRRTVLSCFTYLDQYYTKRYGMDTISVMCIKLFYVVVYEPLRPLIAVELEALVRRVRETTIRSGSGGNTSMTSPSILAVKEGADEERESYLLLVQQTLGLRNELLAAVQATSSYMVSGGGGGEAGAGITVSASSLSKEVGKGGGGATAAAAAAPASSGESFSPFSAGRHHYNGIPGGGLSSAQHAEATATAGGGAAAGTSSRPHSVTSTPVPAMMDSGGNGWAAATAAPPSTKRNRILSFFSGASSRENSENFSAPASPTLKGGRSSSTVGELGKSTHSLGGAGDALSEDCHHNNHHQQQHHQQPCVVVDLRCTSELRKRLESDSLPKLLATHGVRHNESRVMLAYGGNSASARGGGGSGAFNAGVMSGGIHGGGGGSGNGGGEDGARRGIVGTIVKEVAQPLYPLVMEDFGTAHLAQLESFYILERQVHVGSTEAIRFYIPWLRYVWRLENRLIEKVNLPQFHSAVRATLARVLVIEVHRKLLLDDASGFLALLEVWDGSRADDGLTHALCQEYGVRSSNGADTIEGKRHEKSGGGGDLKGGGAGLFSPATRMLLGDESPAMYHTEQYVSAHHHHSRHHHHQRVQSTLTASISLGAGELLQDSDDVCTNSRQIDKAMATAALGQLYTVRGCGG